MSAFHSVRGVPRGKMERFAGRVRAAVTGHGAVRSQHHEVSLIVLRRGCFVPRNDGG